MSVGCLPPTLLIVIHGYISWIWARTASNFGSSGATNALQTVSVTGACEALGFEFGTVVGASLPPAVHAVAITIAPAAAVSTPRRRIMVVLPSIGSVRIGSSRRLLRA